MSYDADRLKAADWWVATKGKGPTEDVPDPNGPPPFEDAVTQMEATLYDSSCFKTSDEKKEKEEFRRITNSEDVSEFLEYWAQFAVRIKEQVEQGADIYNDPLSFNWSNLSIADLASTGVCGANLLLNAPIFKRYIAAYLSVRLNLKYSLTVLAIEGVQQKYGPNVLPKDNMAQELQAIIKPDLYMATDLKKGAQLAVMAMAHAIEGTTMSNDPHVNFLAAIQKKEVPRYCLLNQEVAPLKTPEVMERNPWSHIFVF